MKNKNNNSPWSLKINTASLVLIPAAVGINYIGKLFAGMLKTAIMAGFHRNLSCSSIGRAGCRSDFRSN